MPKRKHEADDCVVERSPVEAERFQEVAVVGTPPLALEEMGGGPSRYAGLSVDHRLPCTSQEGRLCHIFGSLKAWNSYLWIIGLELEEKSISELSVVKASDGTRLTQLATWKEKVQVGLYLYRLLAGHHCVVEATINDEILADHLDAMCRAIRDSRGLKRITMAFSSPRLRTSLRDFSEAMASLTRLESLSLDGDVPGAFLADLAPMLAGTASLKVLRAADIRVENPPVCAFRRGLFENTSVTELSLTTKVLDDGSRCYGPGNLDLGLASYLRANTKLTSLSITAPRDSSEIDVWTICLALSENVVLTRLDLDLNTLSSDYAAPINSLLHSSKTLRCFSLKYKFVDRSCAVDSEYRDLEDVPSPMRYCSQCRKTHPEVTEYVRPWIKALLTDGTSLKVLTLSMWAFCLLECQGIVRAMAGTKSPEKFIVTDLNRNTLQVCSALSENGAQERVLVNSRCIVYYPDVGNPPWRSGAAALPFGILQAAVPQVTTTAHLTEITLQVFSILCATGTTDPASTAIVQLIERAPCVKYLVLCLQRGCCSECWNRCASAICDAVCRNSTIEALSVHFSRRCRLDMAPLASLLHQSRTLRSFTLEPPCHDAFTEFLTKLLKPEFENNYALQRLKFYYQGDDMMNERLAIQGIVHRNRELQKHAAAYVAGTRAKYAADAFEKLFKFPTLIEELQSAMFVQEARAKQLVAESALRLAQFLEFMCLAGVVFDRVECNPTDDGRTQLDDLPELCLRRIRQFLRLSDVQD